MLGKRSSDDVGGMMGITWQYMENIWTKKKVSINDGSPDPSSWMIYNGASYVN